MNLDSGLGESAGESKKGKGRLPVVVGCYTVPVTPTVSAKPDKRVNG